jgi:hypothetical protein
VAGPLSARPGRLTAPSPALHPKNLINEEGYYNFGLVRVTKDAFGVSIIDDAGTTRFEYKVMAQ